VVYTAEHLSLAVLEALVHAGNHEDLPEDLVAVPVDIPDALPVRRVTVEELPVNWRRIPAPPALANLGTEWARSSRSAVLVVRSAIVPVETAYLLNPLHQDFRRIRIGAPEPFELDPRLIGAPRR